MPLPHAHAMILCLIVTATSFTSFSECTVSIALGFSSGRNRAAMYADSAEWGQGVHINTQLYGSSEAATHTGRLST